MRAAAALATLVLLAVPARAEQVTYEGPKSKRYAALEAFKQLMADCPRVKEAMGDFKSIRLLTVTPASAGDAGKLARVMEADTLVIATFYVPTQPRVLPPHTIHGEQGFAIAMVGSPGFSGMVLQDRASQWLCNKAPLEPGDPMALLRSDTIGQRLAR